MELNSITEGLFIMAAKKSRKSLGSLLRGTSALFHEDTGGKPYIPSIEEFCYSPAYLGLRDLQPPINLYPIQMLVLKAFYRGSPGNENVHLTEEDIVLCKQHGLDANKNGNIIDKWNNKELFRELVLVWGRRCLSEDCKLVDPETGKVWRIGDAWEQEKQQWTSWTFDESQGKMRKMENCRLISQGKREVFQLITDSGHEIEATENHPFLTKRGWVQLKDIIVNEDEVAIAESQPFFGNSNEITEDEAALLGYMTGDGNCSQVSAFFTCGNDAVLSDFRDRLSRVDPDVELFQYPWTSAKSAQYQYKIRGVGKRCFETFYSESKGRSFTRPQRSKFKQMLIKHGIQGKTCHYKEVPTALYECPKNVIAAYLRALYSCDGCIYCNKNRNAVEIEFYTVNHFQAMAVQHLLSRFGIYATLREKRSHTHIKREGKEYDSLSYRVSFSLSHYVKVFLENIGFYGKDDRVIEALQKIKPREGGNMVFTKVYSIISSGEKETFDLQISDQESLQNFTSNGFIVKNSGKDFVSSILALYEAMKLLESPNGDPYKVYNLASSNPFTILTIANNQTQAHILYSEMREKFARSPYFRDKFVSEGITSDTIYLLTPKDKRENEELKLKGIPQKLGSICIRAGHSNSDGLVGIGCYVLLLDEVAAYKTSGGASSGDRIYTSLTPTIKTYVRREPLLDGKGVQVTDPNGLTVTKSVYDGKIISISSPRGMDGVFYNLYENAHTVDHRLMCRLPTWEVNPTHAVDDLRESEPQMTDERFRMEYGAEFSGTAGENFFPPDYVVEAFKCPYPHRDFGLAGHVYFAHLDPAISSHNYALCVVHKEHFVDPNTKKLDFHIIVDHVKFWSPEKGQPIQIDDIDAYMIALNARFHLGIVTYDQWNSQSSINKLRKAGIPATCTRFSKSYKVQIYDELHALVAHKKLQIPNCLQTKTLKNEMLNLQRRFMAQGYRIYPKTEGEVRTDDLCDALAGACFNALKQDSNRLPLSRLVNMGISPSANSIQWRTMSGDTLGFGPGGQVADYYERSAAYRNRSQS